MMASGLRVMVPRATPSDDVMFTDLYIVLYPTYDILIMYLPFLGASTLKEPELEVTVPPTNELSDFSSCTVVCATALLVSLSITFPVISRFCARDVAAITRRKIISDKNLFIYLINYSFCI